MEENINTFNAWDMYETSVEYVGWTKNYHLNIDFKELVVSKDGVPSLTKEPFITIIINVNSNSIGIKGSHHTKIYKIGFLYYDTILERLSARVYSRQLSKAAASTYSILLSRIALTMDGKGKYFSETMGLAEEEIHSIIEHELQEFFPEKKTGLFRGTLENDE